MHHLHSAVVTIENQTYSATRTTPREAITDALLIARAHESFRGNAFCAGMLRAATRSERVWCSDGHADGANNSLRASGLSGLVSVKHRCGSLDD